MRLARTPVVLCLATSIWGCSPADELEGDAAGGETGDIAPETETGAADEGGESGGDEGGESGGNEPRPETDDSVSAEEVACALTTPGTPVFGQLLSGGGVAFSSTRKIESLALDEDFVYFRDDFGVYRAERGGGSPERLVELDGKTGGYHLVLHGAEMSWIQSDTRAGWELWTAAKTGGSPRMITSFDGSIPNLRAHDGDLVWDGREFRDVQTYVLYTLAAGTVEPRIIAAEPLRGFGPKYGWVFDVEDGFVYAAGNLPGGEDPDTDAVFRLPVEGGEPELLAGGLADGFARALDADAERVYILDADEQGLHVVPSQGVGLDTFPLGPAPTPRRLSSVAGRVLGVSNEGDAWFLEDNPRPFASLGEGYGPFAHDGTEMFVAYSSLECTEWEEFYDEHTGSTSEFCVRAVAHRCVAAIAMP